MMFLQWIDREDRQRYFTTAPDDQMLQYAREKLFSGSYIKLKKERPAKGIFCPRHFILEMYEGNYTSYKSYILDKKEKGESIQ